MFNLEQVVKPDLSDAVDLAQAFGHFVGALVLQAPREGLDDLLARQPIAGRALDREDERETEPGVVVGVQLVQRRVLLGAAQVEPRPGLLAGRFGGQLARNRSLAREFRVGADQAQLFIGADA